MKRTRKLLAASLAGCAIAAATAHAAPVDQKDAADFDYIWEFDGVTTAENYDRYNSATGAPGADGTNEFLTTPAASGGTVTIANTSFNNSFWVSSAAAAAQMTTTTGFTVEYRVMMDPNVTTGNDGGITLDIGDGASLAAVTGQYADLDTDNDLNLYWDLGPIGTVYATVPADEFFTVRIVATHNPANTTGGQLDYSLYVNDQLVGDNLTRERALAGRRLLMGDVGGGTRGTLTVDYLAYTPGAFAPIPEPASMALLAAGAATMLVRRRAVK